MRSTSAVFRLEFGLDEIPTEPGVILIRGARQYGKSTWLEGAIRDTVRRHGAGVVLEKAAWFAALLRRSLDREAERRRSLRHAPVVGDDRRERRRYQLGSREMYGERSEDIGGDQARGIEQRVVEPDQVQRSQQTPRPDP